MRSGWSAVRLGDVVTLQRGFDLPSSQRREGLVPIVSSSGITGTHAEARVAAPAVVTGRYGTLGQVFYLTHPCWPLNTTLYVRDFHNNDPRFCYYFLLAQNLGAHVGAAAVPGVNRNVLHELPALRPPPEAQRKIAAILSAYDDLIENNNRRIKLLEEMAQRIYREWFVDFRYPGHEGVRLVDSELGRIPEGWLFVALHRLVEVATQIVRPARTPEERFQHFSIPAFDAGQVPTHDKGRAILSNKFRIDRPCVLYSKLNPRIPRVWWVDPAPSSTAISSTELLPLISRRDGWRAYIFALARSDEFAYRVNGMAGGTSTSHQRVRPRDLLDLPVLHPQATVLDLYTQIATPLLEQAQHLRRVAQVLSKSRDALLPRLISGEIDVDSLNIAVSEGTAA